MHAQLLNDDFWTHDTHLFEGVFRYYRTPRPVRAKIHMADERYFNMDTEILPLRHRQGLRTYVMMHPYVFEPQITLTVGLYNKSKHYVDMGEAIGETKGIQQEGVREVKIGNAQA